MTNLGKTFVATSPDCRYAVSFNWISGEHTGYFTEDLAEALADYAQALAWPTLSTARIEDRSAFDSHGNVLTIYRHGESRLLTRRMRHLLALTQPTYPEWGPRPET